MINKMLDILASRIRNHTQVKVSDERKISADCVLKGSRLFGDVTIGPHSKVINSLLRGKISIGTFSSVNGPNTELLSDINEIVIGNFCSIARNVSIQESNHNTDRLSTYFLSQNLFQETYRNDLVSKGPITIGHDVWISTQCVILSGSTIGNGAVVAANSVVNGEIPPYAIVGGTPAKVIRFRFSPEVIERLQHLEWWNWGIEKLKANKDLFMGPISMAKLEKVNEPI